MNKEELEQLKKETRENPIQMSENDYFEYRESYGGICLKCREVTHDTSEPDAEEYECPGCGENAVYGIENALLCGFIEIE